MEQELSTTKELLSQAAFDRLVKSGSDVKDADLSLLDLTDSDMEGIRFIRCSFDVSAEIRGASLQGTHWSDCKFRGTIFCSCEMQDCTFEDCSFYAADERNGGKFRFCELEGSQFKNCDLQLHSFEGSQLYECLFQDCMMRGATFPRSSFSRSFSRKVVKSDVSFINCDLAYSSISEHTLVDCTLSECNLSEADLSETNLIGANLSKSNLIASDFSGASLDDANLEFAKLQGFNLLALKSYRGMRVSASEQHNILLPMGIEVSAD